ncbi:MAG TPA: cytochrome c-type biogenesis protein [Gaiella sp.]
MTARPLLAVAAVLALAPSLAPAAPAAGQPSAADLEAQLVCPTCKTTLDMSDAPVARRMKAIIRAQLAAGATEAEIKTELVDQFGQGVLAEPPKRGFDLLAWVLPLGALVLGAVGVGVLAWSWSRRAGNGRESEETPLDPALERRLEDELARFDG